MTIKPFGTYPETRDELLRLSQKIEESPAPEGVDREEGDFVSAAYALADLVSGILKDEKYGEEKGVYDDDWRPIDSAPHGSHEDMSTWFLGGKFEYGRILTATCYRNKYGAFEWFGGGMMPTHWQPLPPTRKELLQVAPHPVVKDSFTTTPEAISTVTEPVS